MTVNDVSPFHGGNTSSNLVGDANKSISYVSFGGPCPLYAHYFVGAEGVADQVREPFT